MVKKNDLLIKNLNDTINGLNIIRKNGLLKKINLLSSLILKTLNEKKKIMFCGNGGSASEASHIAAEFVGRYLKERKEQSAISLTTDNSIITAIGNDYSFDEIFSKQVKAKAKPAAHAPDSEVPPSSLPQTGTPSEPSRASADATVPPDPKAFLEDPLIQKALETFKGRLINVESST